MIIHARPEMLGRRELIHTHQTVPTQFVEANGIRFAYRRFGKSGGVPLVFSVHYTGTMDYWDPAVTDGLAKNREAAVPLHHLGEGISLTHPRQRLHPA
jgi:hypothetical protein